MPQGGSVSLELLPIIFIAVRRGVVPAAVTGLLYGLLQLGLPGAFVYHPAQAALDYPLAFMSLCVAGFVDVRGLQARWLWPSSWRWRARFVFHFLSGLIFFAVLRARVGGAVAVRGHLQPAVPACPKASSPRCCSTRRSRPTTRRSRAAVAEERRRDRAASPPSSSDGVYEETSYYLGWAAAADLVVGADGGAGFLLDAGRPPGPGGRRLRLAAAPPAWRSSRRPASSSSVTPCARTRPTASSPWTRRGAAAPASWCSPARSAPSTTPSATSRCCGASRRPASPSRLVAPRLTVRVLAAPAEVVLDAPARHARLARPAGRRRGRHADRPRLPARARARCRPTACLGLGNSVAAPRRRHRPPRRRGGGARRERGETFGGRCRARAAAA